MQCHDRTHIHCGSVVCCGRSSKDYDCYKDRYAVWAMYAVPLWALPHFCKNCSVYSAECSEGPINRICKVSFSSCYVALCKLILCICNEKWQYVPSENFGKSERVVSQKK